MIEFLYKFRALDKILAVTCFLLLLIGLALIYSTGLNGDPMVFIKQAIYSVLAIVLFFFFAFFDFRTLTKISRLIYLFFVIALVLILEFGISVQGSARWFDFKVFRFQPAEFTKLVVILVLARYFALRRGEINNWKTLLTSFLYVLVPMVLIAKEPDLGSAIVIFGIWFGTLLLSSVRKKVFVYIFIALAMFGGFAWTYILHDYQRNRIETFLDPNLDPKGKGYNVKQAIIAVGSGGVLGKGLGHGLQSQLRFLPERQTDFIFASAGEELGFVGTFVILILYFIILYRLMTIYRLSRDDLSRFLIAGIFFMMLTQIVINIGMNIGIMPVTGIPLPLLSYGGSSLWTLAVSLGIAEAVAIHARGLHLS